MSPSEFARRRRSLMRQVGRDGAAILTAAQPKIRNRGVEYVYRQESDFFYLTGFGEPEAVAVFIPKREAGEFVLFCRERDAVSEVWDGPRAGLDGARERFGADDAFPIEDLDDILPGLIEGRTRIYHAMGAQPEFDARLVQWMAPSSHDVSDLPQELVSLEHMLHDMRLYKSRAEIAQMRRAAVVASRAHRRAMQQCRPGMYEYEVEAELAHTFRSAGARNSYPPIVASGANTCILHYIENNQRCQDGDLLLIDAGCELQCYASDVTRTFPVNGRFTAEQRAVYEVVLKAQYAAIDAVKPGNHWNAPHEAAVKAITRGLANLGLLKGSIGKLIKEEAYKRFFMHRTGHWLGMDVHDVGNYKVGDAWRELEPGMVLTVEPGVYIAPGSKGVPRKWWGIGVRIEDDVLVTRDGHDVLSADAPKEIAQIEALMALDAPEPVSVPGRRRPRAPRRSKVGVTR